MATRVKLLPKGMRELLRSNDVASLLEARMRPVLAAAKADPHDDTRAYEDGLRIEKVVGPNRVAVRVVSTDKKGHILEARYGILSRALDASGGRTE